jgi:hypothetical protein
VILVATAACGAYHFPGPGSETGTVSGHVISFGCGGPVQPADRPCLAQPMSDCPAQPPNGQCGKRPIPGLGLVFTKGNTSFTAKTDSAGAYSIELPVGTWKVSTTSFVRIISGPQALDVTAGAAIVADYTVDNGMRAAA